LSSNQIGAAGAASLAPELGKLLRLTWLGLHTNQIDAAGAASLAPELGKLVCLTLLSLSNNQIGDYGFGCLSTPIVFLGNTPGAMVELQNNNITDQIRQMPHPAYIRL